MKKVVIIVVVFTLYLPEIAAQRYRAAELKSICNATENEMAPVLYDSGLVFLSNKIIPSIKLPMSAEGPPLNIYYVPFEADKEFGKMTKFDELFSTDAFDGPVTFAQNETMICVCLQNGYSSAGLNLPKNGNSGLYFAYKSDDRWDDLTPFEYNDPSYNYTSPCLSSDGLTLYFAAEGMEDSFGGWDIYVSRREGNAWTLPENLGPNINTSEWELFPYLHQSGKIYFSSRGHNSRGGSFDVFSSSFFKGSWSDPVPVPSLNTYSDEIAIVMDEDYSEGYLTRRSGNDYDILKFEYPNYESFTDPDKIQKNRFCFRLRETTLDTINYDMFSYEWVINDTLAASGHDIKFCFPGPGDYYISFNVTNKITDTVMVGVATLTLNLRLLEQPVITAPDTVRVGQLVDFNADQTVWNKWKIEGYYWDFGNGVHEKGENVRYQYLSPGEYTVILGIKEETRSRRDVPEKTAVFKEIVVLADE